MKTAIAELDKCGHLHSDEVRENIIAHYVQKFADSGLGLNQAEMWAGGTGAATTRREKLAILARINKG